MLGVEDNKLLCQVGPGTPMGDLMREYWIPALRSEELPAADAPPLRVRLLGEDMIAFRTTSGRVGLIQNACPHRGASLFFGRNEEEGLRCIYHGWKFDTAGACVDTPSEPAESNFRNKVEAKTYPCQDVNGVIWTYMGKRTSAEVPPMPELEAFLLPQDKVRTQLVLRECNWMQGIEGELDTVHQAFLHIGAIDQADTEPGSFDYYITGNRPAVFDVIDTDFGTSYGAYRPAEADTYYWRVAHFLFPFYAMTPTGVLGPDIKVRAYVPIDDNNTMLWLVQNRPQNPGVNAMGRPARAANAGGRTGAMEFLPNTSDWLGRHRITQTYANDFMIDREAQARRDSYTGINGILQQDMAVTESMGPIYDRSKEHLGTTDALIIRTRRKLIAAAKALRNQSVIPPGVDQPGVYRTRSGGIILPRSVEWQDATRTLRYPEEAAQVAVTETGGGAGS
ncbi:MAG TPA: Rieske 2Fe-2S domain-containing protein [Dehalococcoidia bacterium]|nr:Rieske 2Fe-2S domain-containing protein [Dehalococcoidia bacterium]